MCLPEILGQIWCFEIILVEFIFVFVATLKCKTGLKAGWVLSPDKNTVWSVCLDRSTIV